MKYSLKAKLSLSYIFVALISVFLISILSNIFFDKQFTEYVQKNQEQKNKEIISALSKQYQNFGKWNTDMLESIGVSALENGIIIKISDISGKIIWDAKVHNNGMCQRIIEHMSQNMSSHYPDMKGEYVEKPYFIYNNSEKVGVVEIGSYGPFYLSDNDLAFINTLNKMLISVGIVSLLFALIIGTIMAKRLSSPISRVITTAKNISKGCYSDRILEKSSTSEINQLTDTINNLADALERQENLRKRLTGDVAHELRTPLATLQGHLEAMIDGIWKPERDRLVSCHDEIVRINNMVGDLERLAKYESENLILDKSNFNITETVQHIINNFESEYANKGINIELIAEDEYINADKDKLCQVIINLLANALKYTHEGGNVEVIIKGDENITQISVKDNGTGISEEDLPYIFERFYRADKSRNRMSGGSGIGLTIAKAIVEAHKGKIEVISKIESGTEFIVSLPKK
ncbi:HAMP domain-containing protein [Ruminiclostridium herbifermentans]|uniref:histidine kinase n=1 Tax=Ruminiclostridium herbifermentans TaxID=2488810 RepID=A0A4U7JKG4_9FIRM|nr:ATP-binding protein [Ruminiclostridium herbifermentans]QNU68647.1 HAMP domain-containing protein [Ruminiclostridium herbifermentans]